MGYNLKWRQNANLLREQPEQQRLQSSQSFAQCKYVALLQRANIENVEFYGPGQKRSGELTRLVPIFVMAMEHPRHHQTSVRFKA